MSKERISEELRKVHITVTIEKRNADFITKTRGLASDLLNAAVSWLREHDKTVKTPENVQFLVRLSKYGKIECCEPGLNRRPSDYESDALTRSKLGTGRDSDDSENFSGLAESRENDKPDTLLSIYEYMLPRLEKYTEWVKSKGTSEGTLKDYLSGFRSLTWCHIPKDIGARGTVTKTEKNAISQMFSFMLDGEEIPAPTFNGYAAQAYKDKANEVYNRTKKGTNKGQKTNELILFPEVVKGVCDSLPEDVKQFYLMSIYCGGRTAQLLRLYENPLSISPTRWVDEEDHSKGGYFWIDGEDVGQGHKHVFAYFFPAKMRTIVEHWRQFRGNKGADSADAYSKIVSTAVDKYNEGHKTNIPANLSSLRKLAKTILSTTDLNPDAAEWTQGRIPQSVGAQAYDNLEITAKRDYWKTLEAWDNYVPQYDWIEDIEEVERRLTDAEEELKRARPAPPKQEKNTSRRKQIIEELKKGKSARAVAKEFHAGRQTVDNIVKELKEKGEL